MAGESLTAAYLSRLQAEALRRGLDPERICFEVEDHMAQAEDSLVRAGMPPEQAQREVTHRLGDPAHLVAALPGKGGATMRVTVAVLCGGVAAVGLAIAHALPSGAVSWRHPAAWVALATLATMAIAAGAALWERPIMASAAVLAGAAGAVVFVLSPLIRPYDMYAESALGTIPDITKWGVFIPGVLTALTRRSLKGVAIAGIVAGYVAFGLLAVDYPFAFLGSGSANSAVEYLVGGWLALAVLQVLTRERFATMVRMLGTLLGRTADRLEAAAD